jgi:hypothetical protein
MPTVQNPLHPIEAETEMALAKRRDRDKIVLENDGALARLRYPSNEERAIRANIAAKTMAGLGIDVAADYKQLEELSRNRAGLFAEAAKDRYQYRHAQRLEPPTPPPPPTPTDHSFWWARTDWSGSIYQWGEYEIDSGMPSGAVVFYGWISEHHGDLRQGSFWAKAQFELQRNRVPASRSNRWISAPVADIAGTIQGMAPALNFWQPFDGDHWAKCSMTCSQTLYQHGFGGEDVVLGRNEVTTSLFAHENGGDTTKVLPGAQAMPVVEFSIPGVADSVWADLQISFAYQVEGTDSYVRFTDNPVSLTFRQWEPIGK